MAVRLNSPLSVLQDAETAKEVIVDALRKGYLTIFLGAGLSISTKSGFPDWSRLVENCCGLAEIAYEEKKSNNKYLRQQIEKVETKLNDKFVDVVKKALYENISYDIDIMKTDLLMAIGSLVMGSIRGNANSLVNYNFDDLLEWYLKYHGYKIQIVSEYPSILAKADMHIFHPHGFLPNEPSFSDFSSKELIFSQKSYLRSYNQVDPWNELQVSILSSNICLFIGLSGEDEHIEVLANRAFEIIKKNRTRNLLGYILLEDNEINRESEKLNSNRGLINLYVENHDRIPEFIRDICRISADLTL